MELETVVVAAAVRRAVHGLYIGGGLSFVGMVVSALLALTGHDAVATMFGVVGIATLARIFVDIGNSRRQERQEQVKRFNESQSPPRAQK